LVFNGLHLDGLASTEGHSRALPAQTFLPFSVWSPTRTLTFRISRAHPHRAGTKKSSSPSANYPMIKTANFHVEGYVKASGNLKMGLGMPIPEGGRIHLKSSRMTLMLIALNVIAYVISSYENLFLGIGDYWVSLGGFVPSLISEPSQWYRIFSSMFLHSDLFHILFNMYFLFMFGRAVERAIGKYRFLALYLGSGIMASLFHTAFGFIEGPISYTTPAIGASGAISGILGAYLMLYPGTSLLLILPVFLIPWFFWIRASYYILFWFAMQIMYGFAKAAGGTAVFAHAGGLVAGIVLLAFLADKEKIAQLRALRDMTFTPYLRFGVRRARGLGRSTKILVSIIMLSLLAGGAYASVCPVSQGQIKSVTLQYTCGGVPYSDYLGINPSDVESQISAIPLDTTRILLNRLNAAGLLRNATDRELSLTGWVGELPVKLKLGSMTVTVNVTTSIDSFRGIYDLDGFLAYGKGSLTTRALNIILRGQTYQIIEGDLLTYEFWVSSQTVDLTSLAKYNGMISVILTAIALVVVSFKDRDFAVVGED